MESYKITICTRNKIIEEIFVEFIDESDVMDRFYMAVVLITVDIYNVLRVRD